MIQKLQLGGTSNTTYFADPTRSSKPQGSAVSAEKEDGIISKDLLKELRGIPVDVDDLMETIADVEHKAAMGMPVSSKTVRAIEARINRVVQQSKYLEEAEKRAEKNDAIGEVAVGDQGQLFVISNGGDIKSVSASEYKIDKHGPALTVNQLIEHRKFNPTQAYDSTLTQVIGNNIGMSEIATFIEKIVASVGSSETSTEAYTDLAGLIGKEAAKRPSQEQLQAIQQLYQISQTVGMDAIFKEKNLIKQKNIQAAFTYINSILPRNMRLQLQSRFVANGMPLEKSAEGVSAVIGNALMSSNDTKYHYGIDYDSAMNKDAAAKTGKDQKRNLKAIETLVQGSLNKIDYTLTSSKNPSVGMVLHGNRIGALANFDNNIVPKSPMSVALESSLGPLVDKQHVTMGEQKISESMFDSILYDGNDVINIWAPTDSNGDIDLAGLQQFSELLEYFDSDPSLTIADKNRTLAEFGISGYINDNGQFVGSGNMAQFLVFTGITSDEVIDKDDAFVDVLEGDAKDFELDQIERIYGHLNAKNKNKHGALEFKKGWFDFSTDIVKAPIFMKLKSTAQTEVGTFANHGPLASTQTYQDQVAYDQMRYNKEHQTHQFYQPSTSLIVQ